MCLFVSITNKYKHKCVVFLYFCIHFKLTNLNVADSVILFQQNKITSRRWMPNKKRTSFKVLLYGGREETYLWFYSLSGKSFISLSLSFTMPSLIRVRSFTLNSTLRKIRRTLTTKLRFAGVLTFSQYK